MPDPVAAYHELLTSGGNLAADSQAALDRGQETRGLNLGTRPACTVLRPRFLTPPQYRYLHDRVKVLLPAFQTIYDRALIDPALRHQFCLHDWEEELLAVDPGYREASPTSRFDTIFTPDGQLLFTEFNTEAPAGAGYSDSLLRLFYGLPVFQEFERQFQVWPILNRPGVLHAITDAFRQWSGNTSEPPRVAILDWREVQTFSEFVLLYDYFKGMGIPARIVDPRDVEYLDGKLMAGDFHITLIYKRVLLSELIERGGIDHAVVRAVCDRAVCMVNAFRCKLLYKKASFAVLSDERNTPLFSSEQHEAIRQHIPWTRILEDRRTTLENANIELIPYVLANKDQLVLKPNDEYGDMKNVSGCLVDQATWEAAVNAALTEPHVVQQQINLPSEPYPSFENGQLHISDRLQGTSPFVAFGSYMHGCLTRLSGNALVNLAASSRSIVPTFVVEPR